MCPVCNGEGRVYRMTPAYEVVVAQSVGNFSWTGPTHEWRRCIPCGGTGLIKPPLLPDDDTAVELLAAALGRVPFAWAAWTAKDPGSERRGVALGNLADAIIVALRVEGRDSPEGGQP
jgi:hypothetical protein